MQYKDLKEKAKNLGMRVTKDVRGKRVKLTSKELRARIRLNFENSVKNAQQVIRVCKTIIVPSNQGTSRIPPPPPPPPPPPRAVPRNPVVNSTRAKLMAELKNTLKKRALKK
jgi:hypothetical protein